MHWIAFSKAQSRDFNTTRHCVLKQLFTERINSFRQRKPNTFPHILGLLPFLQCCFCLSSILLYGYEMFVKMSIKKVSVWVCVKRQRNFIKTWEIVGGSALLSPSGLGCGCREKGGCIAVSYYFHTIFPFSLLLSHPLVLLPTHTMLLSLVLYNTLSFSHSYSSELGTTAHRSR